MRSLQTALLARRLSKKSVPSRSNMNEVLQDAPVCSILRYVYGTGDAQKYLKILEQYKKYTQEEIMTNIDINGALERYLYNLYEH